MKLCTKCFTEKPFTDFGPHPLGKYGLRPSCKSCIRAYNSLVHAKRGGKPRQAAKFDKSNGIKGYTLHRLYGLTLPEYEKILESQGGKCKICGLNKEGEFKSLSVDHCHKTGRIRGILCTRCNTGLGNFKDDIELLKKAIEYLKG